MLASFDGLGRCALRKARSSARHARYRCRPPFAATSRETVDVDRFNPMAITWQDVPEVSPREISSRSSTDKRSIDRGRFRGLRPPVLINNRRTDLAEQPTKPAASTYRSPVRTRRCISRRSEEDNLKAGPDPRPIRNSKGNDQNYVLAPWMCDDHLKAPGSSPPQQIRSVKMEVRDDIGIAHGGVANGRAEGP
jgi:hypothetical protein